MAIEMLYPTVTFKSHPSRGAWIEMLASTLINKTSGSRTPHGVRGLKCFVFRWIQCFYAGRTPHGVRGLKSTNQGHPM